jgi:hypothetical protein
MLLIGPITNWLQPNGRALQIIFLTPLLVVGGGVLGAVHNVSSLHTDELSLGCYSAPWPGVCVPAGVCACVFSCGVFSFRPLNECLNVYF